MPTLSNSPSDSVTIVTTVAEQPYRQRYPTPRAFIVYHVQRHLRVPSEHACDCAICLERLRTSVSSTSVDTTATPPPRSHNTTGAPPALVKLPCAHMFHFTCLREHVHHNSPNATCPLCREPIPFTYLRRNNPSPRHHECCGHSNSDCSTMICTVGALLVLLLGVQIIGALLT